MSGKRTFEPGDPDAYFEDEEAEALVELPLDGNLDLHTFHPKDVRDLVASYLEACREKGVLEVRIVHGKGIGALRRQVHRQLGGMAEVERFWTPDERSGGWGATWVRLRPPGPAGEGEGSDQK